MSGVDRCQQEAIPPMDCSGLPARRRAEGTLMCGWRESSSARSRGQSGN
jgi:hypothetical protein